MYRLYSLLFTLLVAVHASAQFDIGIGGSFSAPLMYNKHVGDYNHALGSPGFQATLRYKAPNGNFVPDISINRSVTILPVTRFGFYDQVIDMRFAQLTAMLNANFIRQIKNNELYYGIGIGYSHLKGNRISASKNNSHIRELIADSSIMINTWMPTVNLNLEYVVPVNAGKHLYAGVGLRVQYIYFYDKTTTYKITVVDENYNYFNLQTKLYGHMLNPALCLSLYYRFGERSRD